MKYVIGDIHGEITKLRTLIKAINEKDTTPEFIFIGDYIDKGEDAKETLTFLTKLNKDFSCIFLLGNHEHIWINFKQEDLKAETYLLNYGAKATMRSMNTVGIWETRQYLMDEFGDFFQNLKPYWKDDHFVAVHSGISPDYYSTSIEKIPVLELLFNRYDFLKQEQCYFGKYKIIFGHTGFYFPYVDAYKIGIDTAACFLEDQPLTAFCLELNEFVDSFGRHSELRSVSSVFCPNILRVKPWRYNR